MSVLEERPDVNVAAVAYGQATALVAQPAVISASTLVFAKCLGDVGDMP